MAYLKKIPIKESEGKTREALTEAHRRIGSEINLTAALANAPAALDAYLKFSAALEKGVLNSRLREKIAVAVAGYHDCSYCASAHAYIGARLGIPSTELNANLSGRSGKEKSGAALAFAVSLLERRGQVEQAELESLAAAGFSDAEMVEILAHVALNTFTNYFNVAFGTENDFPAFTREVA